MTVFEDAAFDDHEAVHFFSDPESGLRAIVAIHNTTRGPAVGGCRMWRFGTEAEAVGDVLRLSRGMTYKSALAELPFGGGKAVVIGDPRQDKSPALWHALGRFVESLGGRYVIAEDVGTTASDLEIVRTQTRHVAGIAEGGSGDPSPATAFGVFVGIRAAATERFGRGDPKGLHVVVQGLGSVGFDLARRLAAAGAQLTVADIDPDATARAQKHLGAAVVAPGEVYDVSADIFAPCALGAVLNDETVPRLKVGAVAGSANNQLAEPRHGEALRRRGILYAPDYAINAGGIVNIAHEGPNYDRDKAFAHVARIEETLGQIFRRARLDGVATAVAADRLAEERFRRPSRKAA